MAAAQAPEASDTATWDLYAEGASRLFDKLTEVPDNFYDAADADPSEKNFYGNGIDMLALPPFVGTISQILIDDEAIEDDYRLLDNYYLINLDDRFHADQTIKITARWGFASVPADVKLVVTELAIFLWRNRDPHFARLSETGLYPDLSPTVKQIIKKFRDRYS